MRNNSTIKVTLFIALIELSIILTHEKAFAQSNEVITSLVVGAQQSTSLPLDEMQLKNKALRIAYSKDVGFWYGDPRNIGAAFCKRQSGVMKDFDGFNFRCASQVRYGLGNLLDTYSNISDACTTFFYVGRKLRAKNGKIVTITGSNGWENNRCEGTVEI